MTDKELVQALKNKFGLRYDIEVARLLNISKQNLAGALAGTRRLPITARFLGYDKLGYAYTRDAVLWLLGEAGERIKEADNTRAQITDENHKDE